MMHIDLLQHPCNAEPLAHLGNMNVLIFTHSLSSGGAERVTANVANHWTEHGWKITVVTLASEDLDFYRVHRSVRRIALDLATETSSPVSAYLNNYARLAALRRVLKQFRPDIVLGMGSTANVLLVLAAIGLSGMSVIVSERTYPPALPLGRMWEWLRRFTYPFADCVVMLTSEGVDWLGQKISKARGVVIPNPILYPLPTAEPKLEPRRWISSDRKLLLAVGRLSEEKGFDLLIEAFSELAPANPEWDLVILGEGMRRSELERLVLTLELNTRVYLPGRAGNVGDWYERADLYVMSSRFEGFPNSLGEAMAHGCAAVSFDCDTGPRDLIRHNQDGILVPPANDAQGLAVALERLMQDDELRGRMAAKATEIRQRYSVQRILAMWDDLFDTVKHGKIVK